MYSTQGGALFFSSALDVRLHHSPLDHPNLPYFFFFSWESRPLNMYTEDRFKPGPHGTPATPPSSLFFPPPPFSHCVPSQLAQVCWSYRFLRGQTIRPLQLINIFSVVFPTFARLFSHFLGEDFQVQHHLRKFKEETPVRRHFPPNSSL